MFPFTFQIEKKLSFRVDDTDFVMSEIKKFVIANKGEITRIDDRELEFTSNFFVGNWKIFSFIDRGFFIINSESIIYKFRLYKLVLFFFAGGLFATITLKEENLYVGLFILIPGLLINWVVVVSRCNRALAEIIFNIYTRTL